MFRRNISFEALRVVFILFMVLHHLDAFNGINIPSFTENIKKFCFEGFVGVNFFFMLSGLGCVLGYKQRLENKEISSGHFLYNRFIKLYPAYILFLVSAIFLYNQGHIGDIKLFFINLFMLQTFPITSNQAFSYNGVAWCISALCFFYCFFALNFRITFKECIYSIAFLFIFIIMNMIWHNADGNVMTALFYTNPIFRLLDFLVGMAIALYFINHQPICSSFLQITSILVFIAFLCGGAYGNIPWLYKWGLYYILPCSFLLCTFYGETKFSQILFKHKFWTPLSSASMIIFLSHQEILNLIKMHLSQRLSEYFYAYFVPWGIISCLVVICIFSVLVNKVIIVPLYKLLKR